jgi:hypothetical protein
LPKSRSASNFTEARRRATSELGSNWPLRRLDAHREHGREDYQRPFGRCARSGQPA